VEVSARAVGALALVAAGVLGLVASALFVVAVHRAPEAAFSYASDGFYVAAGRLQRSPRRVLICAGMAGLYFALDDVAPKFICRMALGGVALVSLTFVFPFAIFLGEVIDSQDEYGASSGPLFSRAFFYVFLVGSGSGMVLCGVAAFWAWGLGRRWFFFLAVGVLDSPLFYWLVFVVVRGSIGPPLVPYADTRVMEISLQVPVVVTSAGWILAGRLLYGARDRENAIIAAGYRASSEENRSKACRLYEALWGAGDTAVVDDLVAEDVRDHEHDRYGREGFKKTIAELHRTFPDLTLSIEEQTADGDTVTTRCAFSGTDSGGVLWYPPTGKHATVTGTFTDRFSDGRLVEHRGGIDVTGLLEQLDLLPIDENHSA
jgi:predicted ester cyclase